MRFQATPNMWGYPTSSGLTVAWLNTGNGRSGVATLDERTDTGTPSLTKTVDSGPGTIVASMWGTIGYPGATCVMAPTIGVVTVYPNPLTDPYAPKPEPTRPGRSTPPRPGPRPPRPRRAPRTTDARHPTPVIVCGGTAGNRIARRHPARWFPRRIRWFPRIPRSVSPRRPSGRNRGGQPSGKR